MASGNRHGECDNKFELVQIKNEGGNLHLDFQCLGRQSGTLFRASGRTVLNNNAYKTIKTHTTRDL